MGRLTLNPIPHIDLLGTILLPLMNAPIGWAKPVPVNPSRFRRGVDMATGDILVSAAGPALEPAPRRSLAAIVLGRPRPLRARRGRAAGPPGSRSSSAS